MRKPGYPSAGRIPRLALACALAISVAAAAGARSSKKKSSKQYKKGCRDQVTRIAKGDVRAAAEWYRRYLERDPKDLEGLYGLALAHAVMNEPDKAMDYVRKAVELGLPFGRFVAGPKKLFEPLARSREFREFARRYGSPLVHGPVVGHVTDTSAAFWVRTAEEVPFKVRLGGAGLRRAEAASAAQAGQSKEVRTRAGLDFTAVVEVTGLEPGTRYSYEVLLDGEVVDIDPRPWFRTYTPEGKSAAFKVVFGGGAGYTPWKERMWDVIARHEPVALLMLGDNVYIDTPTVPETQSYCYYRRQSRPEYRRLTATTSVYAIWDDHDFGTNDCVSAPEVNRPSWKPAVWKVFKENWVNPPYAYGGERPGCWFRFSIADVDFFMLDTRSYRTSPKLGKRATILGPDQRKWLLGELARSRATFRVLASSVPWAPGTKPGSRDTWDGFPHEREEVFSFIEKNRLDGVLLISADRHRSDAWRISRPGGYDLYDLMSSKLTNVHTHSVIKGSLFGYNAKCSFGELAFDTTKADPEVAYRVFNIEDELVHTLRLRKSQLSHPR